jgi:hypothetical protein
VFDKCIKTILNELNSYIKTRAGINEDQVIYANYSDLATSKSNTANPYTNKIIMTLVDIVHQDTIQSAQTYVRQGNHYISKNSPINFYLHILFAAHFEDKHAIEGLSHLARVIAFFQFKNHFTSKNTPTLSYPELEGISVSLIELSYEQKSLLWRSLNSTYLPSVVYKIGMIPIEDKPEIWPEIPVISDLHTSH